MGIDIHKVRKDDLAILDDLALGFRRYVQRHRSVRLPREGGRAMVRAHTPAANPGGTPRCFLNTA